MATPNIITDATNAELRATVAEYVRTITVPGVIEDITAFADEYLGENNGVWGTWVEPYGPMSHIEGSLGLLLLTGRTTRVYQRVDISLAPPRDWPAAIVKPFWYNRQGKVATLEEITWGSARPGRRIVRCLTEQEGVALVTDLHTIMALTPPDEEAQATA